MKHLYAPWRSPYARGADKNSEDDPAQACPFCVQIKAGDDTKYAILKRGTTAYVCLNKYPYNAGHLLVIPYEHQAFIEDITSHVRAELMELIAHSTRIVKQMLGCEGVNIGINVGKAAGAGIPAHLHAHVLPRWHGDTNFLPVLCETKVISLDLRELYDELKPAFDALVL